MHPGRNVEYEAHSVIVNYQVPIGSKFVPIMINECVTMIQVGSLNGSNIWEPINTFLRSPEEGLRYHRTMDVSDPFKGPLDILPWGTPVQGAVSDDQRWMIDPGTVPEKTDETHMPYHYSIASPSDPQHQWETHAASSSQDIDLELLAQLGTAVTRGAQGIPSAVERGRIAARPLPPSTVGSVSPYHSPTVQFRSSPYSQLVSETTVGTVYVHHQPSLIERAAEAGKEAIVTTVTATAGALAGAALGDIVGGDVATSHLGAIAEPLGQFAGRHIGRVIGGTLGASAIRCSSRSASRKRSPSQVRFAVEPPHRPAGPSRQPSVEPDRKSVV
jgi:hypothetical protein